MKIAVQMLKALLPAAVAVFFVSVPVTLNASGPTPTGEVVVGNSQIEPAYNDLTGGFMYLLTPMGTPAVDHTNSNAVAPLYVVMYPTSVSSIIGTVNCQHQPMDNCPDHGPELAGLAKAMMPSVYGGGVWGHDHVGTGHPNPKPAGGDFNVAWVPVAVLFKSTEAAMTHITTLTQLNAAIAAKQVVLIPLTAATFQCSPVAATVYNNGTPVTPVSPLP
ncbi:MAG TPA: hypothetical protein VF786_10695 [Terriglobales bacterium]